MSGRSNEQGCVDSTGESSLKSYQELYDEAELCQRKLKEYLMWGYGCLIVGWIVLLICRMIGQPPYNHPLFGASIFSLTFLAATSFVEKEHKLDMKVARCAIDGVKIESGFLGHNTRYFRDLSGSFEGSRMWQFAFIRTSPILMIIFSILQSGALSFLVSQFSLPPWLGFVVRGLVLGVAFITFSKIACRPYIWMLESMKYRAA